jgi:hypothetical protein
MKLKHFKDLPVEYDDYDICLSSYFTIPDIDEDEPCVAVIDNPISDIAINDESKEIRFILPGSAPEAIQEIEDNIKEINEIS